MNAFRLSELLTLRDSRLFWVVLLLSTLPLWLTPYLPFVDVPQHAAQVASLHELLRGNPVFTSNFWINWFTPYVVGYLLLFIVSSVLPIVAATKVVLAASIVAIPLMTGLLLREMGADERLKWLAIPASYSVALYWGFFEYVVATPVALAFLVLTIRFERRPTLRYGLGIGAFGIMLFFCHVVALGFASLLCLTYLAAKNWRSPRRLIACCLPYAAPLPIMAVWMTRILATDSAVANAPTTFGTVHGRLLNLFEQLAGLDAYAFGLGLLIVVAVLFLPVVAGYRVSRAPERWLLFVVGLAVYFSFPEFAQNTAFLYQRLAVFLIPLWLVVWESPSKPSRYLFGTVTLVVLAAWLGVNTERFTGFGHDAQAFESVLAQASPGRRLAGMLVCNASRYFSNPVYLHFAAWYQAQSAGVADISFATTHPSVVRYSDMSAPRLSDRESWLPFEFSWSKDGGDTYDYYLVCSHSNVSEQLFKDHVRSVGLVAHQGEWWLYQNNARSLHEVSVAAQPRPCPQCEEASAEPTSRPFPQHE